MLMPLMLRPGKSISKQTLTRGHFMKKLHPAKMNGFNSISLAANFDAPISRHTQKLYPQTACERAFPKSLPQQHGNRQSPRARPVNAGTALPAKLK
jgi:hypothetical protein